MLVRVIDGERLVYHSKTGDTHWLGSEAAFVFDLLWSGKLPMSSELMITLAQQQGFNQIDAHTLENVLKGLCAQYLVKIS